MRPASNQGWLLPGMFMKLDWLIRGVQYMYARVRRAISALFPTLGIPTGTNTKLVENR